MHTFFIKQIEYQSSYLVCEKCFYLLSGMHQNLLELLFREPVWINTQHSSGGVEKFIVPKLVCL